MYNKHFIIIIIIKYNALCLTCTVLHYIMAAFLVREGMGLKYAQLVGECQSCMSSGTETRNRMYNTGKVLDKFLC